jgi:hypothetical protein
MCLALKLQFAKDVIVLVYCFCHLGGCKISIIETINRSEWTGSDRHTNQRVVVAGRQQVQWGGVCDKQTHKQTNRHHVCFDI